MFPYNSGIKDPSVAKLGGYDAWIKQSTWAWCRLRKQEHESFRDRGTIFPARAKNVASVW